MQTLRTLLLDGANNHDWRATTPALKAALEATGRFAVTVSTCPPRGATDADWAAYRPDFRAHGLIVSNYFDWDVDRPWPDALIDDLVGYVQSGGGLAVVHAGAAAFTHHRAFNGLLGVGWRDAAFGERIYLDDAGQVIRVAADTGDNAGHGAYQSFVVDTHQPDHPVNRGLPPRWRHLPDELWHGLRGPAGDMTVLATAHSDVTRVHEPLIWTVTGAPAGAGRVFVTVLGHDTASMACPGFRQTLARGCEWAATGGVTPQVGADFPT